jgi:Tfp pilus assembly protein PilP
VSAALRAVLAAVLLLAPAAAAAPGEIPAEARAREARLLARASPAVKAWVRDEGRRQAKAGVSSEGAVQAAVRARFSSLGALSDGDIMAIAFLVMMEAARSAQEDLKAIMAQVKSANAAKARQRAALQQAADAKPSPYAATSTIAATRPSAAPREALTSGRSAGSDLSQMDQLRLQRAMERHARAVQTLSNILKALADTQSAIISNLK